MRHQLYLLSFLLLACAGCANERVWRCPDGSCGGLSGRFGCGECRNCDVCGEPLGRCRCHFFSALRRRWTCGEGCGETYWGPWISDPPAPCDPCDECTGQFVGRRCCPPKRGLLGLVSGRFCDGGCADGGCPCQDGGLGVAVPMTDEALPPPVPPIAPQARLRPTPAKARR